MLNNFLSTLTSRIYYLFLFIPRKEMFQHLKQSLINYMNLCLLIFLIWVYLKLIICTTDLHVKYLAKNHNNLRIQCALYFVWKFTKDDNLGTIKCKHFIGQLLILSKYWFSIQMKLLHFLCMVLHIVSLPDLLDTSLNSRW